MKEEIDKKFKYERENIPIFEQTFPVKIVWINVVKMAVLHIGSLFGIYFALSGQVKWQTFIWTTLVLICAGLGVTAGCHRLWSHRSYKAKLPLRIILALFQTLAVQKSILYWCKLHRMHHKYSDTNGDPHNASRGFFFAHIGWFFCRLHPGVIIKGKEMNYEDLLSDPVVAFQHKYYLALVILGAVIPTLAATHFWGEAPAQAICFGTFFRICFMLHLTFLVNSAAHLWGTKPFDKNIGPVQNWFVTFISVGEGMHNYHHAFPWDYKADELYSYNYNHTTTFINFFARIGWAYDLRTASKDIILNRVARTGDGSHPSQANLPQVETPSY